MSFDVGIVGGGVAVVVFLDDFRLLLLEPLNPNILFVRIELDLSFC